MRDENIKRMRDAIQNFCNRVERGEIKSQKTYAEFKEILETSLLPSKFSGGQIMAFMQDFISRCQRRSAAAEYGSATFFINEENYFTFQKYLHEMRFAVNSDNQLPCYIKINIIGAEVSIYKMDDDVKNIAVYYPQKDITINNRVLIEYL